MPVIDLGSGKVTDQLPDIAAQLPQPEPQRAGGIIDLDTGKFAQEAPEPAAQPKPEFIGSSVIEPAAAIASSIIAEPIAGLVGLTQAINPFADEGAGARAVQATREALTFKPRTEAGQESLQAVGGALEPVGKALKATEEVLGEAGFQVGGAIGGTIGATIPTLLMEALGLGLVRKATRSTGRLVDDAGNPAPELAEALERSGITFDQLPPEAVQALADNRFTIPEEVLRSERFKELGIPATTGDITQEFSQQATEARLLESAADESAAPIRTLRLEQSTGLIGELNKLVDDLGVPSEVGDSLKGALSGRKKVLSSEKRALYGAAANAAPEIKALPILTDTIADAMPDLDTLDDLSITAPDAVRQVKTVMARFGIDKSDDAIEALKNAGIEAQPLTLGNFERFRKTLNQIERSDQTGAASVMTGPIKRALDGEASLIDDAVKKAGIEDATVLENLTEARARVRTIKTEFSPEAITGKLINVRRDGVTPTVESSKVFNELMGPNKAPELLDRTLESLRKAGDKGQRAISDLQAATVMKLVEDSLKAQTRKIRGEKVIGSVAFQNSLDALSKGGRMDNLFKNNKSALKRIQKVGAALKDITPPSGAVPKGSAGVILDTLNRLGLFTITNKIPGIGPFAQAIRLVAEKGSDRAALDAALKGRPTINSAVKAIKNDFPNLATVLGIGALTERGTE